MNQVPHERISNRIGSTAAFSTLKYNTTIVPSLSDQRLFIPISLGNHYYTNKILKWIMVEVASLSSEAVFFICDKLRYLTYKIRKIEDDQKINLKVETEVHQFKQRLKNCGIENYQNYKIATWSFVSGYRSYHHILNALGIIARNDADVDAYLNHRASCLIDLIFNGRSNQYNHSIQKQYIIEETALSLFMTEIYGTNYELYRRMDEGLIVYLYQNKLAEVKDILFGRIPKRTFVSLENLFSMGALSCKTYSIKCSDSQKGTVAQRN